MNEITVYDPDDIRKAVKEVKNRKPDFSQMLDLYEKIFIAQEEAKRGINLPDYTIPDDVLAAKLRERFPLVETSGFRIDVDASARLFPILCDLFTEPLNELSGMVKLISDLAVEGKIRLDELYTAFISGDESVFERMENEFSIGRPLLGFLVYNSLKPSVVAFSGSISGRYLEKDDVWEKGYCPVCGSAPELSVFEENGKRFLVCGFCNHKWASKRIYCPFCDNSDHETLQYFEIEDEEEYRVDVCDRCKKFIKTVDTKKTTRTIYLPLEKESTPYIDLRFREMGYRPGNEQS